MKKHILRSVPNDKNEKDFQFVVVLENNYYFTHNPDDATRFDNIGDAMKKSIEIYDEHKRKFQVFPVYEKES